jgi:hypothetical protein
MQALQLGRAGRELEEAERGAEGGEAAVVGVHEADGRPGRPPHATRPSGPSRSGGKGRGMGDAGRRDLRAGVGTTVRENSPYARCFACLAVQLTVTEKIVREAAQVLIARDVFVLKRRVCYTCGRTQKVIIPAELS